MHPHATLSHIFFISFAASVALFGCGAPDAANNADANNQNNANNKNNANNGNNANNDDDFGNQDAGSTADAASTDDMASSGDPDGGLADMVDIDAPLRAFPGAQGFGTDSVCGRGGRIFVVNDQQDFDSCVNANEPRVCVFAVSGTFRPPQIRNPFITIAGESAPSPGIQLTPNVQIRTHDVCLRHLRVRGNGQGDAVHINFQNDGQLDQNEQTFNVVLDHLSVSWSGDENISSYAGPGNAVNGQPGIPNGRVSDVTLSNSISSEGMAPHSMGFLAARPGHDRFSVIGNIFAHNNGRNPKTGSGRFTVVNNLIYNHSAAIRMGSSGGVFDGATIGNAIISTGPNTNRANPISGETGNNGMNMLWVEDTMIDGVVSPDPWADVNWVGDNLTQHAALPAWFSDAAITPMPSIDVQDYTLACAGARPKDRDAVDQRIVADIVNGTGAVPSVVPQLPNLDGGSHTLPAILSSQDPSDWTLDSDDDGYTDVEEALYNMALALECD